MITSPALWITTAAAAEPAGGFLGWQPVDLPMVLCLPLLLVASGFFSGSETALFSLSEAQRMDFRARGTLAGRAVDALLADQRMLLITVLLGNMTVNVLFFVISSVLMLRSTTGALGQTLLGIMFLLLVLLVGEVTPKLLASGWRVRFAALSAPGLFALHRALGPLRVVVAHGIVEPLSRLTAPRTAPPDLSDDEIKALLDISGREGVIDDEEHRILHDVLGMRTLRVRDVMTPRVKMVAIPATATRADVEALTREHRLTKIPIHGADLDEILGTLHVKRYLLDPTVLSVTDPVVCTPAQYVPEIAHLDQLLDHFRRGHVKSSIVVDEYGGTEGVVAVEDVVEELVGDIVGADEEDIVAPRLVALGQWRVSGQHPVEEFSGLFGLESPETRGATIGVLVAERLGRSPVVGDRVELEAATIEVEAVERTRATWLLVTPREDRP